MKNKMNRKGQYHTALVFGFILIILVGGIVPYILSDFAITTQDYGTYLTPIKNIIQFYTWGNFEGFLLGQLQGFSLIPSLVAIPLLLLSLSLITYGTIKLIPETELGTAIAGVTGVITAIAGIVGALFGGST